MPMTEKSPNAFRTISEVADLLEVPAHVLRFWESKFSQIKPVKRGGGRRYYRPSDVSLIKGIRNLLYSDGLTIKGVQKILREKGTRQVIEIGEGRATAFALPDADAQLAATGLAEPNAPKFEDASDGTKGFDFTDGDTPMMSLEEDIVSRVAAIAEEETTHREELREIVRKLEILRDSMRDQ